MEPMRIMPTVTPIVQTKLSTVYTHAHMNQQRKCTVGALIMHLSNYASNPILKLINFQFCVTLRSPSFYCCVRFQLQTTHMVRSNLLEQWIHSLCWAWFAHTTSTGEHGRHLLGKGYKRQRTKQWTPPIYALAVLSKQRTQPIRFSSAQECAGGAAGHCGGFAHLCSVKPRPPFLHLPIP